MIELIYAVSYAYAATLILRYAMPHIEMMPLLPPLRMPPLPFCYAAMPPLIRQHCHYAFSARYTYAYADKIAATLT